ncbi:MAG TPA: ferritin-like domain-containing protein, partial [Abditibacteriaceae bacterium]
MSHAKYNRIPARSAVAAKTIDTKKEANARRELLTKAALAAGTAALAGSVAKSAWAQAPAPAPAAKTTPAAAALQSDLGILNFALTLEYLEADFYTQVVAADTAVQYLRGRLRQIAPVLRDHEIAHVEAITATITKLGGTPVARPTFRFPQEAMISPVTFARFAYTLEEIGVGAYLGAVGK